MDAVNPSFKPHLAGMDAVNPSFKPQLAGMDEVNPFFKPHLAGMDEVKPSFKAHLAEMDAVNPKKKQPLRLLFLFYKDTLLFQQLKSKTTSLALHNNYIGSCCQYWQSNSRFGLANSYYTN